MLSPSHLLMKVFELYSDYSLFFEHKKMSDGWPTFIIMITYSTKALTLMMI